MRLEFEDLRCLLGGTTEWLARESFFVPSADPVEPGHACRFEIGLGRRGPWIEGVGEVVRAVRLPTPGQPTGTEIAIQALSEESVGLLGRVFEAHDLGGDEAVAQLVQALALAHEAEAPTEAMPTAIEPAPDPADDTAPVFDDVDEPDDPAEAGAVREKTLVLADPQPASPHEARRETETPSPSDRRAGGWGWRIVVAVIALAGVGLGAWLTLRAKDSEVGAVTTDAPPSPTLAEAVAATDGPPWLVVESIRWEPGERGLEVRIETSAAVAERGFRHYRLEEGGAPRELLKLYGAVQGFDERYFPVGGRWLSQIRTGSHFIEGVDELHVVFDLASPTVRLTDVAVGENGLVVTFSGADRRGETVSQSDG